MIKLTCIVCNKEYFRRKSILKIHRSRFCSNKCKTSFGYVDLVCTKCGKNYKELKGIHNRRIKVGKKKSFCSQTCFQIYNRGKNHGSWKGGRYITEKGYIRLLRPGWPYENQKLVFEHVFVMAKYLKRMLYSYECIHHINGNKQDNRIENLELLHKSKHSALHNYEKIKTIPTFSFRKGHKYHQSLGHTSSE